MYGITDYEKLFYDGISNSLIYVGGFKQSHLQMSIRVRVIPLLFRSIRVRVKLFYDGISNSLMYVAGLKQSHLQMSIHYKYTPDVFKLLVLSYVDDCVFWYTSEELRYWFLDTLGNSFRVNFLGYAHWFISIRISQLEDYSISVE